MVDLESKITLRAGIFLSAISALVVFTFAVLWAHQTDITILKVNQAAVMLTISELKIVPGQLVVMSHKLETISADLKEHRTSSPERKNGVGK